MGPQQPGEATPILQRGGDDGHKLEEGGVRAHNPAAETARLRRPVVLVAAVLLLLSVTSPAGWLGWWDRPSRAAPGAAVAATAEVGADRLAALAQSVERSLDLTALAEAYFRVWNEHNAARLGQLFQPEGSLRDWDVEVSGRSAVAEANAEIFRALPRITIEVLAVHAAALTHTAICELLVRTHDEEGSVLKVVDVIEFGRDGKIKALRAYNG